MWPPQDHLAKGGRSRHPVVLAEPELVRLKPLWWQRVLRLLPVVLLALAVAGIIDQHHSGIAMGAILAGEEVAPEATTATVTQKVAYAVRCEVKATGKAEAIHVTFNEEPSAELKVRLAWFADKATEEVGTLKQEVETSGKPATGKFEAAITATEVTKGEFIWLAFWEEGAAMKMKEPTAAVCRKETTPATVSKISEVTAWGAKSKLLGASIWLSGTETGGSEHTKTLTGSLSFAGSVGTATGKRLAGSLTPGGALARAVTKTLTGSLSFAGQLARAATRSLTATLTFAGAVGRTVGKTIMASLSSAVTFAAQESGRFVKHLTATLSFQGAVQRNTGQHLPASLSFAGGLSSAAAKTLKATLTFAGVLQRATARAFAASLSFAGTVGRGIGRALKAALSFAGRLVTSGGKLAEPAAVTLTDRATWPTTVTTTATWPTTVTDTVTIAVRLADTD